MTEFRTKHHEFTVAVVLRNWPWDNSDWRTWNTVTVRRPADFDIHDRDGLDAVVKESVDLFTPTKQETEIAYNVTGRCLRLAGGVIINHSAIQDEQA